MLIFRYTLYLEYGFVQQTLACLQLAIRQDVFFSVNWSMHGYVGMLLGIVLDSFFFLYMKP